MSLPAFDSPSSRLALRQLAAGATPGPWSTRTPCPNAEPDEACGVVSEQHDKHGHIVSIFQSDAYDECSHPVSAANAAFIAAASPSTIIALLDQLAASEQEVGRLRVLVNEACEIADEHLTKRMEAVVHTSRLNTSPEVARGIKVASDRLAVAMERIAALRSSAGEKGTL